MYPRQLPLWDSYAPGVHKHFLEVTPWRQE